MQRPWLYQLLALLNTMMHSDIFIQAMDEIIYIFEKYSIDIL